MMPKIAPENPNIVVCVLYFVLRTKYKTRVNFLPLMRIGCGESLDVHRHKRTRGDRHGFALKAALRSRTGATGFLGAADLPHTTSSAITITTSPCSVTARNLRQST